VERGRKMFLYASSRHPSPTWLEFLPASLLRHPNRNGTFKFYLIRSILIPFKTLRAPFEAPAMEYLKREWNIQVLLDSFFSIAPTSLPIPTYIKTVQAVNTVPPATLSAPRRADYDPFRTGFVGKKS
jgi:hypothetical protein